MSRKDYIEIAAAIREQLEAANVYRRQGNEAARLAARGALQGLAARLTVQLRRDNPNFDAQRFNTACGWNET